jgi:hypothetical protein
VGSRLAIRSPWLSVARHAVAEGQAMSVNAWVEVSSPSRLRRRWSTVVSDQGPERGSAVLNTFPNVSTPTHSRLVGHETATGTPCSAKGAARATGIARDQVSAEAEVGIATATASVAVTRPAGPSTPSSPLASALPGPHLARPVGLLPEAVALCQEASVADPARANPRRYTS